MASLDDISDFIMANWGKTLSKDVLNAMRQLSTKYTFLTGHEIDIGVELSNWRQDHPHKKRGIYADVARKLEMTTPKSVIPDEGDTVIIEEPDRSHVREIDKRIQEKFKKSVGTILIMFKWGLIAPEDMQDTIAEIVNNFQAYSKSLEETILYTDEDEIQALVLKILREGET